jgi:nicotinate-nucleotide pyrophosphorylase (carboxylating)
MPEKAVLNIKQDGILAGIAVAETIFKTVEPNVIFNAYKKDGEQ